MPRPRKIESYIPTKGEKKQVPSKIDVITLERAKRTALKNNIKLVNFIEGALNMFCDQIEKYENAPVKKKA